MKLKTENFPILEYTSFSKRLLGLMFQKKKIEYGICFPKCNSIHTMFMFQTIDIIMTDKEQNILYMKTIKPWRIILPKKNVYYTYELPEGYIEKLINKTIP